MKIVSKVTPNKLKCVFLIMELKDLMLSMMETVFVKQILNLFLNVWMKELETIFIKPVV